MLNIQRFSKKYQTKMLNENDIDAILRLYNSNPIYYDYCPPNPSKDSVLKDMQSVPPNTDKAQKYFVGYYQAEKLIAVLDLIVSYPDNSSVYIGLFMLDKAVQSRGIGCEIITDLTDYLTEQLYKNVQLAYINGNQESERFWLRQKFSKVSTATSQDGHSVITMMRELK